MIRWIAGGTAALLTGVAGATSVAGIVMGLPASPAPVQPIAVTGFVVPVTGYTVTQPFGCSSFTFEPARPSCASGHWHSGIDLAAPEGTPVRSTLAGTVQIINSTSGYGLHVVVDHGAGLTSVYGHLSAAAVHDGTAVGGGAVIGAIGSTGNSTGPHLHFEIRRAGVPEDPAIDVPLT